MSYTIIKSDGNVLTTIPDGTINTTSTSLGLPGRNFPTYGQVLDTNFVRMLENFASNSVPAHPIRGQLWYNTNDSTLRVCPADGSLSASSWPILSTTSSAGNTTLGNLNVTGTILLGDSNSPNIALYGANGFINADSITVRLANVTANATIANANVSSANITTLKTNVITAGNASTTGTITGTWTFVGNGTPAGSGAHTGSSIFVGNGNIEIGSSFGIRCDNYMYANGSPFNPSGTYNDANVCAYLSGKYPNGVTYGSTTFTGNIAPNKVTTTVLTTGSAGSAGTITGTWTLTTSSTIQSTYSADIAERYAADAAYEPGTVVELGGDKEVTIAQNELTENVFGVVSNSYSYLLNGAAGDDSTHPPIALIGRVFVKTVGKVTRGERLVSAGNGKARAGSSSEITPWNVIGRALTNKDNEGDGLVEVVVIVK